ncbi:MAG: nitrate reductase cytochrome c-type subunit [Pseudomonadota bacterium]|jgi:cytochrome c-type protein NapB
MRKSVTITLAALLTVPLIAFSGTGHAQGTPTKSLRGADVAESDAAPEVRDYVGKKPGRQKPIPRTFLDQPPLIPHAVDNFDEITLEENQCLSCHGPDKYKEKEAPRIGDSHFLDRDGNKLRSVSMSRHNCTQCHVPQTDAPPLVENTFKGELGKNAKKK